MGSRRTVLSSFSPGNAHWPCPVQIKNGWGKKEAMVTASVSKVPNGVPIRLLGGGGQVDRAVSIPRVDSSLLSSITLTTRFPQKYLIIQLSHHSSSPKQWSPLLNLHVT